MDSDVNKTSVCGTRHGPTLFFCCKEQNREEFLWCMKILLRTTIRSLAIEIFAYFGANLHLCLYNLWNFSHDVYFYVVVGGGPQSILVFQNIEIFCSESRKLSKGLTKLQWEGKISKTRGPSSR